MYNISMEKIRKFHDGKLPYMRFENFESFESNLLFFFEKSNNLYILIMFPPH